MNYMISITIGRQLKAVEFIHPDSFHCELMKFLYFFMTDWMECARIDRICLIEDFAFQM